MSCFIGFVAFEVGTICLIQNTRSDDLFETVDGIAVTNAAVGRFPRLYLTSRGCAFTATAPSVIDGNAYRRL